MKTFYIVWNEGRNEGIITDDPVVAKQARTGKATRELGFKSISTLAANFYEYYGDERLPRTQKIEL